MGLFDGLMGNASEVSVKDIAEEYGQLLGAGEQYEKGYILIRDLMLFTNKRLILIDKQGMTGKKTEYMSIPYKNIYRFSVETAGHFDLDAELKLWIAGEAGPIKKQFNRKINIYEVQAVLAAHL